LNKRYLALITINNIKDAVSDGRSLPQNANYLPYSVEGGDRSLETLKDIADHLASQGNS
jgi:hypothetical protein